MSPPAIPAPVALRVREGASTGRMAWDTKTSMRAPNDTIGADRLGALTEGEAMIDARS